MANGKKTKWFCITQWNLGADYEEILEKNQIRYIAYGEETCPTTGRKHHQLFCYFRSARTTGARSLKKIGGMWGEIHCNVEPMRGSVTENETYCSKENKLVELGEKPRQGARGDLDETKSLILKGKINADEILEENPMMYHQYGRTIEKLEILALRKKWRSWMTEGIWIHGESGTGKTHMAMEGYNPDTHYIKNLNEDWWDGYKGQSIVVINEFRGQIRFSEILDLVDKWPKTVKWRGKESVPFLAHKVIITSIFSPRQCYSSLDRDEPWEQFERRFSIMELDKKWSEGNNRTSEHFGGGGFDGFKPAC